MPSRSISRALAPLTSPRLTLCAAACLVVCSGALTLARTGQPQVGPDAGQKIAVYLEDGSRIVGVLVERNDQRMVVRVGAIETTIPQSEVRKVEIQPSVREEYKRLRAAILDSDAVAIIRLARWLQAEGLIREALYEVEELLKRQPGNAMALTLARQIEAQIALENKRAEPSEPKPARAEPEEDDFPLLSPDQVNVLKVYEIDMADPPRIEIDRAAVEELMRRYADDPAIPATQEGRQAILRQSPQRTLELMFQLRARDMYGFVEVLGHPESMHRFKTDVHRTWLISRCAESGCHGGEEAGGLRLYNRAGRINTDEAVYTNFLILDRYRTADGRRLIDVDDPERSILLQIALPRDSSLFPHPEVGGEDDPAAFKPAFRSTRDRRFQQAVEWIESLYQPRVDYPIEYPAKPKAEGPSPTGGP